MKAPRTFCPPAPCAECPFTRGDKAVRLTRGRVLELTRNMLSKDGLRFSCHKTVSYDDDADEAGGGREDADAQHCTGALIFAEKHRTMTQWMRWMERIGVYRHDALRGHERVFDSTEEMLATAFPDRRRRTGA